jgi:hypothetical protein
MHKHLFATFLVLSIIPFFSITNPTATKQPTKTQLLNHLKNVKVTLQKHLKFMHDNYQEGMMCSNEEDNDGDLAGITFVSNLSEDFYRSSTVLQQKVSEFVTPTFNFICNNIKPLTLDELSLNFSSHKKSGFDENTTLELRRLFQCLYNKHCEIFRNSNPNGELIETPTDELFEQCLWFILGTNDLFIYESRALLQKIDAKIKELS